MNRPHIRKHMEQDRMTRLMKCGNPFFLFRNHAALLLRSDSHFDKCLPYILLLQEDPAVLRRQDCRLIQQVLQIGSGKTGRRLSNLFQVHFLTKRFALRMYPENLFPSLHIRTAYHYLTVKTPRTKDRRIQDIHTVRGRHYNDSFIDAESVHLDQQLI